MQTITAKKSLKRTAPDTLLPSAALSVPKKNIRYYQWLDKPPEVGDVVYGMVRYLGFHTTLENKEGRIHIINDGSRSVFVFGNRYAPDAFEGFVPEQTIGQVDMLARSGIVGQMTRKNVNVKDPTRVEILGYVCDKSGQVVNTRRCPRIKDPRTTKKIRRRSPMILVVGTSMNSGK
ncbi:MAG: hypothetical protein H8E44_00090, partial [Planctomycetes bacterium]|nr:hypothetical protein [Planctomycetota bacterium]